MQVVQIGDVTTGKKCWVSHFIHYWNRTEIQITVMLCSLVLNRNDADGFGDYFSD
jgi:hypothetical protein